MNRLFSRTALWTAVSCVFVALAAPVVAATAEVKIIDNKFDPENVQVAVGGTVHWSSDGTSKPHNVTQEAKIFTSGAPTSNPIDFSRTFSAGTFPYFCFNHGSKGGLGMAGVVEVPVTVVSDPEGLAFTVIWATGATNTGSKHDIQFRIGSGTWKKWKTNTAALKGVFGKDNQPVRVVSGKTYSFRARSKKGDAASEWSPSTSIKT